MSILDNVFQFPDFTRVQRTYNWDFILPNIGLIPGIVLSKYCQSVKVGQYDVVDILKQKRGAEQTYLPGVLEAETLTASFIATAPDTAAGYFHAWKRLIVDSKGYYGLPIEYKKNATIVLYDRSFSIPTNIITVKGLWPVTFPKYNLDYNSEDIVRHEITFRFDKIAFGLDAIASHTAVGKVVSKARNFLGTSVDNIKLQSKI